MSNQLTPPEFLSHLNLPNPNDPSPSNPHITLTWAQSLDFRIAGERGKRVILSGEESMLMTHWMRSMHQAILVGIGTVLLDDPRLQINLLPSSPTLLPPQPLILDPKLRFPPTTKLQIEWNSRSLRPPGSVCQPWILCGEEVSKERISSAEENGARVIPISLVDGRISPQTLPSIMTQLGLSSVMIEGGSRVLSSFLHARRQDGSSLVDRVVVTVAPTFIGNGIGVVPLGEEESLPELINLHTEIMGKDAVMVCKVR